MSEETEVQELNNAPKRGRPKGKAPKRKYAKELADLEGRVQTAGRLLRKAMEGMGESVPSSLVAVAIETLEG